MKKIEMTGSYQEQMKTYEDIRDRAVEQIAELKDPVEYWGRCLCACTTHLEIASVEDYRDGWARAADVRTHYDPLATKLEAAVHAKRSAEKRMADLRYEMKPRNQWDRK